MQVKTKEKSNQKVKKLLRFKQVSYHLSGVLVSMPVFLTGCG